MAQSYRDLDLPNKRLFVSFFGQFLYRDRQLAPHSPLRQAEASLSDHIIVVDIDAKRSDVPRWEIRPRRLSGHGLQCGETLFEDLPLE